ncbi:MAG: hypothetical protein ACOCQ4_01540 [bacterium]
MAKTLKVIQDEKESLIANNEFLNSIQVKDLNESKVTFDELSDFIERCWHHDYADEIRMKYSPSFLRYLSGKDEKDLTGVIAEYNNEIVGVELGVKRLFENKEKDQIESYVGTGMSIDPSFRRKRINQLLWLSVQEHFIKKGASLALGWIDERHNWGGSSNRIYTKSSGRVEYHNSVPCYVKSLDIDSSVKLGKLGNIEKVGLVALNTLFPHKKKSIKNREFILFAPEYAEDCANFLFDKQYSSDLRMVMTPEEVANKYTFSENGIDSVMFMSLDKNKIKGLLSGFTIPVSDNQRYFQVDFALFDYGERYSNKRAFMANCHSVLNSEYDCFGVILPRNVANENVGKYGYVPLGTQAIIGNLLTDKNSGYDKSVHEKLYLDLR